MLTNRGYILQDINWEQGQNSTLHLHCICNTPVRLYPYPKKKGFRLHWVQLYDKKGWQKYIKKEKTLAYKQGKVEQWFKNPENFVFSNI